MLDDVHKLASFEPQLDRAVEALDGQSLQIFTWYVITVAHRTAGRMVSVISRSTSDSGTISRLPSLQLAIFPA